MKIKLSTRLNGVEESTTARMAEAARLAAAKGIKVTNFSVGEPNFAVPEPAMEAAIKAIRDGFHKYTPFRGIAELREGIAGKLQRDNQLNYSAKQVLVTCGAKQAIFNFLLAVVTPGEEVIVQSPYWTSYPEMVKLAGGVPVIARTTEKDGFKLSPAGLKNALSPKTKAVLLNSPSNPTGIVYTRAELAALARVLEGTDVLVCSDEIYEKLIFEGEFASFGAVSPDAFQRTVTVNGFSKSHAMTGWRLGYAAGPEAVLEAMALLQGQSTSGANSVTQKAAVAGLGVPAKDFVPILEKLRSQRDRMMAIFREAPALSFLKPPAAFYLFLNAGAYLGKKDGKGRAIADSERLAFYLLDEAQVATVPGSGFGEEGYLRLSFAVSEKDVEEGSRRTVEALLRLK